MLMLRPNLSAIVLRGTVFKEGDEVVSVEPSRIGFIPFKGNPRELPGPLLSYCHRGSPEHTYKFPFHHFNLLLNLNLFFYSQLSGKKKKKSHVSTPFQDENEPLHLLSIFCPFTLFSSFPECFPSNVILHWLSFLAL